MIAYNAEIPGIVARHAALGRSIHAADIYSAMTIADLKDGIHPADAGYSKMATVWFNKLIEIGFSPDSNRPTVSLTEPATDATFAAPANITMHAAALDADGTVTKVEFFQGTAKLGEDLEAPYSFTWSGVPPGTYSLTAKAVDNDGLTSSSTTVTVNVSTTSTSGVGAWSPVLQWPTEAVHMSILPDGKVLVVNRSGGAREWDPVTNTFTLVPHPTTNTFCAGHSFLPDGRLLVAGGHVTTRVGVNDASIYDYRTKSWTPVAPMNDARWYPTNTSLPNGEVLVVSGSIDQTMLNMLPQVWQTGGGWRDLTGAVLSMPTSSAIYPWMFVAPDGRVFNPGPDQVTRFLDTSGSGSWSTGPTTNNTNFGARSNGTAVMYEPGKILIAGGGFPATNSAEVIDLNEPSPVWRNVSAMNKSRAHANSTILPDGKVLVTGGGYDNPDTWVYEAELWNPVSETWSVLPRMEVQRWYHSTAVLLPDGRVVTAGSDNVSNAQIYSPQYLFSGPRPTITSAPDEVTFGQTFLIDTPDAENIAGVTLIRLPSVTHSFNMNTRFNRLSFSRSAGGLEVTAPGHANLSPPGHYMLFVLNGSGVPSVAKIIRIN